MDADKMCEITITHHAIKRFLERGLHQKPTDRIEQEQMEYINDLLINELRSLYPIAFELGSGEYRLKDYNIIVVIIDFKMTTVKGDEKENPKLNGGILRSGGKIKKLRGSRNKKTKHTERDINSTSVWDVLDDD